MTRDAVPAETKRQVLVEAGHRCAIPTCRATTTEIAHIIPWAKSHDNSFANLIALCPNCHTRFDQKKEIDLASIKMYKANLSLINQRYSEFEKRVFEYFATAPKERLILAGGNELHLAMAVKDGIIRIMEGAEKAGKFTMNFTDGTAVSTPLFQVCVLTDMGIEFIKKYIDGRDIS